MVLEDLIREALRLEEGVVISDTYGPGQIDEWDSLAHVNLITQLESSYNISFEIEEAMEMETVADIKRILGNKGITLA